MLERHNRSVRQDFPCLFVFLYLFCCSDISELHLLIRLCREDVAEVSFGKQSRGHDLAVLTSRTW